MRRQQLFATALVLIGLGVPRVVDAVEIAYGLDIKRDVGVLPWLLAAVVVALGGCLLLAPEVVETIVASGTATLGLAIRGVALVAGGVGVIGSAMARSPS